MKRVIALFAVLVIASSLVFAIGNSELSSGDADRLEGNTANDAYNSNVRSLTPEQCTNLGGQVTCDPGDGSLTGCGESRRQLGSILGCIEGGFCCKARITETARTCDQKSTAQERIKCRLQNEVKVDGYDNSIVPEACKRLSMAEEGNKITKERCRKFYGEIRPCYDKEGSEKLACFKRVSGLGTAAISGNADKTALREYVVSLLYELEERIEKMQEAGNITAEQAAETIDLIVQIKEKIMNGGTREEVRPMLAELKTKLRELRA